MFTNHELMTYDQMVYMHAESTTFPSIISNQTLRCSATTTTPPRTLDHFHHRTQAINAHTSSRTPPHLQPHFFSPRPKGILLRHKSTNTASREDDDYYLQTYRPRLEHIEKAMEQSRWARHVLPDEGPREKRAQHP